MSANLDFKRTFQYSQALYSVVRFSLKLFHYNNDLENMKLLYEKLPLSKYDRDIIDSIFCCIQSRNEMVEKLAYYAGMSDALEFLKQ